MKLIKLIAFSFLAFSCQGKLSEDEIDFKNKYKSLRAKYESNYKRCQEQRNHLLKTAVTELEKPSQKEQYVQFEREESKALEMIKKFDFKRMPYESEASLRLLLRNNCTQNNLDAFIEMEKDRKYCDTLFDEFNFMKALIYAQKDYSWNQDTKVKSKELILNYINKLSSSNTGALIHYLISGNLIKTGIDYDIFPNSLRSATDKALTNGENRAKILKKRFLKDLRKNHKDTCSQLIDRHDGELQAVLDTKKEFSQIYNQLNPN